MVHHLRRQAAATGRSDTELSADAPDDVALVVAARRGDVAAFDELYRRHQAMVRRTARWMTHSDHAADDIVADVFAGLLSALRNGKGPDEHVPAYLRAAVRNRCIEHRRLAQRAEPTDADRLDEQLDAQRDGPADADDASATSKLVATAFATLHPRWQRALWLAEVEGRSAREIADDLHLPAAAVPTLTYRARRAFAEAYLRQHTGLATGDGCRAVADKLPRYVRRSAGSRDVASVDAHLAGCAHCRRTVEEMRDLNASLRTLPVPPVVAMAGAGALTAWLSSAAAIGALIVVPTVALRGDRPTDAVGRNATAAVTVPPQASPVSIVATSGADATVGVGVTAAPAPPSTTAPPAGAATTTTAPPPADVPADPAAKAPAAEATGAPTGSAPAGGPVAGASGTPTPSGAGAGASDGGSQPSSGNGGGAPAGDTGGSGTPGSPSTGEPGGSSGDPGGSLDVGVTVPLPTGDATVGVGVTPGEGTIPVVGVPVVPAVDATVGVTVPGGGAAVGASVDGGGATVSVDATVPGGVGASVSAGTGGVSATVSVPPVIVTIPPIAVEVTLPEPVTSLVQGVLGGLFGPPPTTAP